MTTLKGTDKQISWATDILKVIEEMVSLGAEELIRREALENAKQNGCYENEVEMMEKVEQIVAKKVLTLSKPKEAKGIARLANYQRITEASDLITIGKDTDVSWKGYFKVIAGIRGDHFSYLD